MGHRSIAVLAFDGLDTLAQVRLDGNVILESDNMFVPHRVDVTNLVKSHGRHEIQIQLDSALLRAREIQNAHPEHKWICWNGESARLATRKAQYHWGWDWGPKLMSAGIWKPIRLEIFTAKIDNLRADINLASDQESATIDVSATVATGDIEKVDFYVTITISLGIETADESSCQVSSEGHVSSRLYVRAPSMWMPAGYGSQNLYEVHMKLFSRHVELHSESLRVGMRRVELIQNPDKYGQSFYFRVNGLDIFCGGSCWIPADITLTNLSPGRYRAWIELMLAANQIMVR